MCPVTCDLVSFAAVIRVATRHATLLPTRGEERCVTSDDPNNGCEGDYLRSCPLYRSLISISFILPSTLRRSSRNHSLVTSP